MSLLRLIALIGLLTVSECCIDVVNNTIATLYGAQCDGMRKALYGQALLVWEWKQTCGPCYSVMGGRLVGQGSDCVAAMTKFNEITAACGGCVTAAPVISPIDASTESSSGSGTSTVELTGPISTIFIVGVCLIICVVGSAIWYCYIRKSPDEKVQEAKLRNFNMLDIQPKKKQPETLLDRGQTYHSFPTKAVASPSEDDDNLYPTADDSPTGEYHNPEIHRSFDKPKAKLFV